MHNKSDDFFDFDTDMETLMDDLSQEVRSSEQLLLDLKVRTGQLDELARTAGFIRNLSPTQRREWLEQNQHIATHLLEQYVHDSLEQFDRVPLDHTTLSESYEFLMKLRHTMQQLHTVLHESDDQLEG